VKLNVRTSIAGGVVFYVAQFVVRMTTLWNRRPGAWLVCRKMGRLSKDFAKPEKPGFGRGFFGTLQLPPDGNR
jgi:hypothetical protein